MNTGVGVRPNAISNDELRMLNTAEEYLILRNDSAFQRFLGVMQQAVDAAQKEMADNHDPRWDVELLRVWRERKRIMDFATGHMDAVIAQRREVVKELFRNIGLDPKLAEQNQDMSLSFLTKQMEAHDEEQNEQ